MRPGAKGAIKKDRTTQGVKDTFQARSLNEVFDLYEDKRTAHTKDAALKDTVVSLLRRKQKHENMINPLLHVKGEHSVPTCSLTRPF